jgi:multiubiquitin
MFEQQQEVHRSRPVRIHIDQHRYDSPNPTTGVALYLLGKVAPGNDLYREVEGNHEDRPVWDDGEEIHLREDEHFHSGPAMKITVIVNGRREEAPSRVLTFIQVVALAFDPVPSGPDWVFTVTYRKAASKPHDGTLTEGATVTVRNGTVFNVTATNKS